MNDANAAPPGLEALLPHRAPMVLLTRVPGWSGDRFWAEVDIAEGSPFRDGRDGGVPAWIGLEYMAQAVSACSAWEGVAEGAGPKARPGLLLGARGYEARRGLFRDGETLRVSVRWVLRQEEGLSVADCSIETADGEALAASQLTVLGLDGWGDLDRLGKP